MIQNQNTAPCLHGTEWTKTEGSPQHRPYRVLVAYFYLEVPYVRLCPSSRSTQALAYPSDDAHHCQGCYLNPYQCLRHARAIVEQKEYCQASF